MISSPTFTGHWVCDDHCVMLCETLKPIAIIGYLPDLPDLPLPRCAKVGLHLRHVNERHGDGGASADFDGGLLSAWWFFADSAGTRCTQGRQTPRGHALLPCSGDPRRSLTVSVLLPIISNQNGTSHSLRSYMSCDML